MSVFSPVGSANLNLNPDGASVPNIVNLSLTANTEASVALPANTRGYMFRLRGLASLTYAFDPGATSFLTLPAGNVISQDGLYVTGLTLYFTTPASGQVLELISWT
jgi:hypothetical protein